MANISQGSTENVVLGEGYSPWALNSNDLYPDSTSYLVGIGTTDPGCPLHINKNTLPASFTADSDAAIILSDDDNNNVIESISTTSRERLKLQTKQDSTINCRLDLGAGGTDIGFYPGGSNQARIGSTGMALGLGGDATPDGARLHIKDASSPQLKLDDGTSSTTFQHDDNAGAPVLRLDSSTLEIEDSVSGGGTQLVLKNGAGDSSTFSQNSTDNGLDIVTTDYHVRLYSTHSSGMASLCDGSGTPKIQWFNSSRACYISGGQQRDAISVPTTAGAYSAGSSNACFLYMCDTSAADVATAGALTFNLPADSTMTGRYLVIKDVGGLAGTYNINITPNGTDKMDNVASDIVSIATNYGSVTLFEYAGWWTIA